MPAEGPDRASEAPEVPADAVELVTPVGRGWDPVARLVLAGIADRVHLSVEELDDLQLAVERLLLETGPADTEVRLVFELVHTGGVRVGVGPLRERAVRESLAPSEPMSGGLDLRRILDTVVDSYEVEDAPDGSMVVNLEKLGPAGRAQDS